MKILRFDHMHVAPKDFEKFKDRFQKFMGHDFMMDNPMPEYGTEVAYDPYPIGVEAFNVMDPSVSVSAKIADENENVFVVDYKVDDLDEATKEMEEMGYPLMERIDNDPIVEAVFDTKDDFGFYIELSSYPFDTIYQMIEAAQAAQGQTE